jgi:hypothetical protein
VPFALVLVACPGSGYIGTQDDPSASWTLENHTDLPLFVEIVEPDVYGRSLLVVGESRVQSFLCPWSPDGWEEDTCTAGSLGEFVFRAHVLDPFRGLSSDAPLKGGRGAPIACVVVPWSAAESDRVVRFDRQESADPRCWTGSDWIVTNDLSIPVRVALFWGGTSFNADAIKFSSTAFQPGAMAVVDGVGMPTGIDSVLVMAFEFRAGEGWVSGWPSETSEPGSVKGAVGPLLYCDIVEVASDWSVRDLHISMNVPAVDGNDRYYPDEGNDGDVRYGDGSRRWIPIQPSALSCDRGNLTDYVQKREAGPPDFSHLF